MALISPSLAKPSSLPFIYSFAGDIGESEVGPGRAAPVPQLGYEGEERVDDGRPVGAAEEGLPYRYRCKLTITFFFRC